MDWSNFWTQLAGGLIGALVGGSAVAYFNGYYSKKGERAAVREELPRILAEERGKAYEQEKGKRLATHEDIQNVLNELRLVTKETETIKATIDEQFWNRRNIWEHRRDFYLSALETINQHRDLLTRCRIEIGASGEREEISQALVQSLVACNNTYQRHLALAKILKLVGAYQALLNYLHLTQTERPRSAAGIWGTWAHERLMDLETSLVDAAQKDLLNE